jgi:putative transposase
MRGRRFTQEQIIGVLKEMEAGVTIQELCRKHGVSDNTIYNWKRKYGGLTVSEAIRLRGLEEENRKLKHIVANQALDIEALKAVVSKNF